MSTSGRPFRWLLLLSLALNVALVATLIIAAVERHRPDHGGHGGRFSLPSPRMLLSALPEDRRALINELYAEHRQHVRTAMRERRQARREVRQLMLASEFDRERIDQAFAELRARDEKAAEAVQSMLIEVLSELTPEERVKVAELVPQRRHRHQREREREAERSSAPAEAESPDASPAAAIEAGTDPEPSEQ